MSYCRTPEIFQELLFYTGLIGDIYTAMEQENLTELALIALRILRQTDTLPKCEKRKKSVDASNAHRDDGNKAYVYGKYKQALEYYNKALLYAPENSQAMKLAYSNRSALLLKIKAYSACLNDIETCIAMGCTEDIAEKLENRRQECIKNLWMGNDQYISFSRDYFKLDVARHPDIPCATTDVEIFMESGLPKVVAAKDIKVGTVVSVEKSYANLLNPANRYLSCFFCNKMPFNLHSCKGCCYALFCNQDCMEHCIKDTHSIECQLMDAYEVICFGPYSRLTYKTVLKMKLLCKWKEIIAASCSIGSERMKNSSINANFDVNHKFSPLSFVESRDAKLGTMYSFAFMCASFIHYIEQIPSFFPKSTQEKDVAMRAFIRIIMNYFLLFFKRIEINNVANDRLVQDIMHYIPNYGMFSFASKLNHACNANLLPVGLNNRLALVALQPIKKGTELTISYVDHANDFMHHPEVSARERTVQLYRLGLRCKCNVCDGTWSLHPKPQLTEQQKKCYRKWVIASQGQNAFKATCETLAALHGTPHTTQHRQVYVKFRMLMCIYQYLESDRMNGRESIAMSESIKTCEERHLLKNLIPYRAFSHCAAKA